MTQRVWRDCGEGPFRTRAGARLFRQAEVGVVSRVRKRGRRNWVIEVPAE